MSYRKFVIRAALAMVAGLGIAGSSWAAGTSSGNVTVSATVPQTCTVTSTGNITVASYDPVGANATADAPANGSVAMKCTKNASVSIDIGGSANAVGTQREMASATAVDTLKYDLYQPDGVSGTNIASCTTYATKWGSAFSGSAYAPAKSVFTSATSAVTFAICGKIPAAQNPSPASDYTDTVAVTVTF